MSFEYIILIIAYFAGFYMAWNIGANDVANSMASAVGARAITLRQAVIIAGVLNVVGAVFLGSHVTNTIRKGIVSASVLADPNITLIGALSALISSALWVSFATWKSLPVSTTHSIVGAMIGFGIMAGGFSVIQWGKLGSIVLSWIISPFFSICISYIVLKSIFKFILSGFNATLRAIFLSPFYIGIAVFVVVNSFLYKTPFGKELGIPGWMSLSIAFVISVIIGFIGKAFLTRNIDLESVDGTEQIFRKIQIGTSCYVALAQGANDVANAIGPLALIYFIVKTGTVGADVPVPPILLFFGGISIACGIGMAGYRVMETIGSKITTLNNTRGYSVDFASATTVIVASILGLPVSTTHAAVGGVIGVGLAGGVEAVNFSIIFQIVIYWILTVPAAAVTSMIIFKLLQLIIV